jgi:LEA14-like dessication related protein
MAISNKKKYIIAAAIGIVTIAGAIAYLQYKKLMNYTIKLRGIKFRSASLRLIDFDLLLLFKNNSNVAFKIESQVYDIYLNNIFVTKLQSATQTDIAANSESPLSLGIRFDPSKALEKLNLTALQLLKDNGKIRIKIDMKLKIKVWGITVNFPYVYEDSLKNLMAPTPI